MALPAILGAIGSIAGPAIGGLLGYQGQKETNALQMKLAQEQMDFQKEMSSTAWQRSMADMEKAGLNPMLAFMKGGASTPSGAMAKVENPSKAFERTAMDIATAKNLYETNKQIKAATEKLKTETEGIRHENQLRKWEGDTYKFLNNKSTGVLGDAGPASAKGVGMVLRWLSTILSPGKAVRGLLK